MRENFFNFVRFKFYFIMYLLINPLCVILKIEYFRSEMKFLVNV